MVRLNFIVRRSRAAAARSDMSATGSPLRRRSVGGADENAKRDLERASPRRSPPQTPRAALSAMSPQQFGESPPLAAEDDTFIGQPQQCGTSFQSVVYPQRGACGARLCLSVCARRARQMYIAADTTGLALIASPFLPLTAPPAHLARTMNIAFI